MTDDIDTRIGLWILKRDRGEISDEQRGAFELWLATDSRHRAAYLRLNAAWERSAGLKAWRPADGSIDVDVLASSTRWYAGYGTRNWAVAAVILVTVVGAMGWGILQRVSGIPYATQVGGYQRIILDDGSVLQLNTESAVRVDLEKQRRIVRLVRGEVYFEVAHDANRPFEVIAGGTVVRAVGTAFGVRLRAPNDVEVTVTQGLVALRSDGHTPAKAPVSAGEVAEAELSGIAVSRVENTEMARRFAWQHGELAFKKDTLGHIVAEFNRYNRRQLVIGSAELATLEVGGNFEATDLDSFVAAVTHSLNVRAVESRGTIHLWAR